MPAPPPRPTFPRPRRRLCPRRPPSRRPSFRRGRRPRRPTRRRFPSRPRRPPFHRLRPSLPDLRLTRLSDCRLSRRSDCRLSRQLSRRRLHHSGLPAVPPVVRRRSDYRWLVLRAPDPAGRIAGRPALFTATASAGGTVAPRTAPRNQDGETDSGNRSSCLAQAHHHCLYSPNCRFGVILISRPCWIVVPQSCRHHASRPRSPRPHPSPPVSNFPATFADLPAKVASRVGFLGSASSSFDSRRLHLRSESIEYQKGACRPPVAQCSARALRQRHPTGVSCCKRRNRWIDWYTGGTSWIPWGPQLRCWRCLPSWVAEAEAAGPPAPAPWRATARADRAAAEAGARVRAGPAQPPAPAAAAISCA